MPVLVSSIALVCAAQTSKAMNTLTRGSTRVLVMESGVCRHFLRGRDIWLENHGDDPLVTGLLANLLSLFEVDKRIRNPLCRFTVVIIVSSRGTRSEIEFLVH